MVLGFWHNDVWTWLWLGMALYFAVVEILAVFGVKAPHGSLSAHVWEWLGYEDPVGAHLQLRRLLAVCLWAVLTAHFFFPGFLPG